jgi:hypothetical protein
MAGKTELPGDNCRETYSPRSDRLLMASKALLLNRCAVPPGAPFDEIPMAGDTGDFMLFTHRGNASGRSQFMTILAAFGQSFILMKKTGTKIIVSLAESPRKPAVGVHPFKSQSDLLAIGFNDKSVITDLKR